LQREFKPNLDPDQISSAAGFWRVFLNGGKNAGLPDGWGCARESNSTDDYRIEYQALSTALEDGDRLEQAADHCQAARRRRSQAGEAPKAGK
jgi:hypothetical protein